MVRAVRYHETGPVEVLRLEEVESPPPGPGEVTIDVEAIGLNRAEIMVRMGLHPLKPVFPAPTACEAAGRIAAVGEGVEGFSPGDAVSVVPRTTMEYGTCAERVNIPARYVEPSPPELDPAEVAALWTAAFTAHGGLIATGGLSAGQRVLLPAASSSVGLAAIQIANMVGATPIAVTRTRAKAARLIEAGAAAVIVSEEEPIAERVADITGGEGVALVFDPIGGPTAAELAETLAQGGTYLIYGAMSPDPTPFPVMQAFARDLVMRTYALNPASHDLAPAKRMIREGVASGAIRPIIDSRFPLDKVVDAYRRVESNAHFGKVVVTV